MPALAMVRLTTVTGTLREFFTLARARDAVGSYVPAQRVRLKSFHDAGECRLVAGRRALLPVPAGVLLREAVVCYLLAAEIALDPAADEHVLYSGGLAGAMPELPPDPARPGAVPSDDERVRAGLASRDPLYFDRLSPEDCGRARAAFDRAASMLRRRIETRSAANLRATGLGRTLALLVGLGYVGVCSVRAILLPRNVALHKPVTPSSVWYTPVAEQDLVDGDTGTSFGVHTKMEDSPSVVIDLLETYRIYRVDVHNRVDGWFDDCLPLVVELSADGKAFREIARREDHFDGNPPWAVDAHREPARYVRVRVARKSYLALSEVEVFAKNK